MSYRRSREIGINTYYIATGVKSAAQIFGLFGDQKYSDSVSRIWFIHEESRNVTNSKLHWTVDFTASCARRNRKAVHLGVRLRKPSKAFADLLGNHEGRSTRERKQVNPARDCANRQKRMKPLKQRWDISRCAPSHVVPINSFFKINFHDDPQLYDVCIDCLTQRFPNPWGSETRILGSKMRFPRSLYILGYTSFKGNELCYRLQSAITQINMNQRN